MNTLEKQWEYITTQSGLNINQILGLFLDKKKGSILIVIPTIDELCFKQSYIVYVLDNTEINIRDIRFYKKMDKNFLRESIINPKYKKLFKEFFEQGEGGVNGIKRLVLSSLTYTTSTKQDFMEDLTLIEVDAYYSIVKSIGTEGTVSINQLQRNTPFSRTVFNNLFAKIKQHNVAEVANRGTNGTYIRILEPELRAEANAYNK